jgi:hypothetical protein
MFLADTFLERLYCLGHESVLRCPKIRLGALQRIMCFDNCQRIHFEETKVTEAHRISHSSGQNADRPTSRASLGKTHRSP